MKLKAHQTPVIEFMKKNRGVILYYSTGSGKTITALSAMYQFKENIIVIGPKSSKKAFTDDAKKLDLDPSRMKFYTFTKMKKLIKENNIDVLSNYNVIVDEAHNLRNETSDNLLLISALDLVDKIILLTATPVVNYLNDMAVLVNIVKRKPVLPTEIKTFNASYYNSDTGEINNKDVLIEKLSNCISYYDNKNDDDNEDYPETETIYQEVEMNNEQIEEYRHYIRKFIYDQEIGSNTFVIDFENLESRKKNFFLSATRQLSNTIDGNSEFPKIQEIYSKIKSGPFPCVVYSNYLDNGIYSLVPLFERDGITYKTITGNTNNEKINYIVNAYNKLNYQVLLLSSAGSESLDLKNTRQIHIMEPHWNESRIRQVIGRAIRYKSHESLPENQRHVAIYRWMSVFPKVINNKSADQYLIDLSRKKDNITKSFMGIIKKVSINNTRNKMNGGGCYNKRMYLDLVRKYF